MASDLTFSRESLGAVGSAGGIGPQMGTPFDERAFHRRFENKERFSTDVARILACVIVYEASAFLGLAAWLRGRTPVQA